MGSSDRASAGRHNDCNVERPRIAKQPDSTTNHAGSAVQLIGLILLSVGAGLVFLPAGVMLFGAGLVFAGTTMELS